MIKNKETIVILNKQDLEKKIEIDKVKKLIKNATLIETSMTTYKGIEELEKRIKDKFFGGNIKAKDVTYISNARQKILIEKALKSLNEAINSAKQGLEIDMVLIDYKNCFTFLGEIIGANANEELLNELFSRFCLGK